MPISRPPGADSCAATRWPSCAPAAAHLGTDNPRCRRARMAVPPERRPSVVSRAGVQTAHHPAPASQASASAILSFPSLCSWMTTACTSSLRAAILARAPAQALALQVSTTNLKTCSVWPVSVGRPSRILLWRASSATAGAKKLAAPTFRPPHPVGQGPYSVRPLGVQAAPLERRCLLSGASSLLPRAWLFQSRSHA